MSTRAKRKHAAHTAPPRHHDRRPNGGDPDQRGLQAWHRLASGGATALGCDPRLASWVWQLQMRQRASVRQRDTMVKIGDIYTRWHHWHGRRPEPASGNLEGGSRAHDSIGELFDGDVSSETQANRRQEIENIIHKVEKDYERLQAHMLSSRIRDVIKNLCYHNMPIGDAEVELIMPTIDRVATEFDVGRGGRAPRPALAITATKRAIVTKPRRSTIDKQAFLTTVATIVQPGDAELVERLYARYLVERDRGHYRQDKAKGRLK